MLLPIFKRLYKNDYQKDYQQLVEQLSYTINTGFENIHQALNKKIDLTYNIACTHKDIQIKVDSNNEPVGVTSFSLSDNNVKVGAVNVGNATNVTNPVIYPTSAVYMIWQQNGNSVNIIKVYGLTVDDTWNLRITAFYS